MRQNVCIVGATGKVGRELVHQIAEHDIPELAHHENPTAVVGLIDSTHTAIRDGGFSQRELRNFVAMNLRVGNLEGAVKNEAKGVSVDDMKRRGYGEELVYVDTTGGKEWARDLHLDIIGKTRSKIATANKNPVGLFDYETYKKLTNDPTRYQYSATAMAGLGGILPWLRKRHMTGDRVHRIDASLSGTLGFITDEISKGRKLSDAIKEAIKLGFTEPDFRDDLNGVDVARKLTILAREAGYPVEFGDIDIAPFLPPRYFEIADPEECLDQIRKKLDRLEEYGISRREHHGMSRRYLASLNLPNGSTKPELKVGTNRVMHSSPFSRLSGTDNYIQVVTDKYTEEKPLRLQGPGAGIEITASVICSDLTDLQKSVSRF